MFFSIIFIASFDLSHKIAFLAPLLTASKPMAPLPENKSKNMLFGISVCIILNNDSFTLSNVGLVAFPSNVYNFVPLAFPPIILIFNPSCEFSYLSMIVIFYSFFL